MLSSINRIFITSLCARLGIETPILSASDYPEVPGKTDRLIHLCKAVGADRYLSGPSAADYIERQQFQTADIQLTYMNYTGYPEYPQPHPPFEHGVSVLDLMFCTGEDLRSFMKFGNAAAE